MAFRVDNFLRNIQALEYYQNCLSNGISSVKDASHPNLWKLGKELYEPANKQDKNGESDSSRVIPPSNLEKASASEQDFKSLVTDINNHLSSQGEAEVKIACTIISKRDGVDLSREYLLNGRKYTEPCHYDSGNEFEDEESSTAVKNLITAIHPFPVEIRGDVVIIRKAS